MKIPENLKEEYGIDIVEATVSGVKVEPASESFKEFRDAKLAELRQRYNLSTLKDEPIIRAYRDFYWSIGIDPTKIRPSSEALLRRILQSKPFPEINNVVDAYNLASAMTMISIGAYDLDKITGELSLDISHGEEFIGIGGKRLTTKGEIVVRDEEKIINIFPYRDADYTKVTESTRKVLFLFSGVKGIERDYLLKARDTTLDIVRRFCI